MSITSIHVLIHLQAAMNMLTKCEAMSYKDDGILCTAIHPGWVKTDLGSDQVGLVSTQ